MQEFDADKEVHAQMLLELRWADDAKAKAGPVDSLGPMLRTEFGTIFGYFPATATNSQVSVFHPEENGQGFNYTYAFVSQAAKNEATNGIAYHIAVSVDSGASAIRATGRIYYKKYGQSAPRDAAPVSNPRDAAPVSAADAADGTVGRDVARAGGADAAVADAAADGAKDNLGASETPTGATSNLIVNGNAEQGAGSTDGSAVAVPGWAVSGNATAVQYGCSGCVTLTDPGPPSRGANFFAGGLADPTSTLTQSISLAAYMSSIDAGKVSYVLQGYLGGYGSQDDNTVLSLSFLNANAATVGTASIGPVLSSDRGGVNALLLRSTNGIVPVGTRSVTVTLTMTRASGTANDGWADDVSLVLSSGVSL